MWKRIEAIILVVILCSKLVNGGSIVPCYFIFGDSLSDAGNNNDLITMAKVNYSPYGIDFPQGVATGRFTNGRTIADFITEFLGFEKFITPATTQTDEDILRGVNYASGAAGILEETSSHLGDRIWMDRQLRNYDNTISKLESMIEGPVSEYLKKCLFTVNIGSNDYINNYFMPQHYNTKNLFTSDEYAQLLVSRYQPQLQALYDSGARKVAIFGLGKIGCIPAELAMNNATKCVDEINQAVKIFNNKLKKLVDYFNANLPGAKFTFINLYAMQSLSPIGLISSSPCCKVLRSDYQCEPNSKPCRNRNFHAYMDGFHPTEFVNRFAATISFGTLLPLFVHPLNISQLVKIDINNNNVLQI